MYNAACCLSLAAGQLLPAISASAGGTPFPSTSAVKLNTFGMPSFDNQQQRVGAESLGAEIGEPWMPLSSAVICGRDTPLSPSNPTKIAAALDARLDLAVEWLLCAVGGGYTGVQDMRLDPDLDTLRRFRPAGFYAAEQMAVARRLPDPGSLRSIASAMPLA